MINIQYAGRFGNNLFQFATAKLLADKIGMGISNPLLTQILKYEREKYFNSHDDILVSGFFQNQEIIDKFSELQFVNIINREDLFVHVRMGDLLETHSQNGDRFMPFDYYKEAIGNNVGGFISSDSPFHPTVKRLQNEFQLELFQANEEETILFASGASKKVLSLGTFSWWIGYLGNQNNVICPDYRKYPKWHGEIFPQKGWSVC